MNRRVSAAEVENNLNSILHDVEEGDTIVITADGTDVAQISRVVTFDANSEDAKRAREALFQRARSAKIIDIGPWTREETLRG